MIFSETLLPGAFIIDQERLEDPRGFFARTWCERECAAHGLNARIVQCSLSVNKRKGTLRGLHYQVPPHQEAKLVRCTRGSIFDVVLDLRADSPTYRRHVSVLLSAENGKMVYVPEGCAHGFQTLEDDTEVAYQMSDFYVPECARGVRWDDPAFGIEWPSDDRIILDRDRNYANVSV